MKMTVSAINLRAASKDNSFLQWDLQGCMQIKDDFCLLSQLPDKTLEIPGLPAEFIVLVT